MASLPIAVQAQTHAAPIVDSTAVAPSLLAGGLLILAGLLIWRLVHQRTELRQLETIRRQHTALLASTRQLVCLLDPDGRVLSASATAMQLGNPAPPQVLGNYFWDTPWWNENTAAQTRLREAIRQALAGQTCQLEMQRQGPNGLRQTIDATLTPVRAPDGQVTQILCEGIDITRQREAEARLRVALDTAPAALGILDREGVFTMATGTGLDALGLVADQLTGKNAFEIFKTTPDFGDRLRHALSGEKSRSILALGTRWVELLLTPLPSPDGTTDGAILFATDITELQHERALRHELAAAIEEADEAIVITDPEGRIRHANPSFERNSGYPLDEVAGTPLPLLRRAPDSAPLIPELWPSIQGGRSWRGRFPNRRKDGTPFTEEIAVVPLLDNHHRTQCLIVVARDISRALAMEEALGRTQRPEVTEKLATGVAHDFNNLIQVVLANTTFARDPQASPAELAEYLDQIEQAAQRGIHITRQLYTYCRKQSLHLADIEPSTVLQDALPRIAARVGPTATIDLVPAPHSRPIRADAALIEQVVGNLCLNARNAMPPGGRITVAIENILLSPEESNALPAHRAGPYVCLAVTDTGCGIPEEIRPRLFDPFFTTKPAGPGTGLGLAAVQGIVQQHGGFIRVESAPGRGSTFRVFLPAGEHAGTSEAVSFHPPTLPPSQPVAPVSTQAPTSRTELILIADDDENVRRIAQVFLKRQGYQVVLAENGLEAVKLAGEHMPQLAVLDAIMPEMGGVEAARLLRKKNPGLPIILASGMDGAAATGDIPGTPPALLGKPYSSDQLLGLARRMLRPART
jgi:PAS domain S-box-containing protein